MQAKITNGAVEQYPYSFQQLKNDNSQTSFPITPTEALLQEFGVYDVVEAQPQYDQATHRVEEAAPTLIGGVWTQTWVAIPLSEEELAQRESKQAFSVRGERDKLIAKTDWTQGKDIPDNVSSAWAVYRQALRDVPQQPQFPWAVEWPAQPTI